MHPLSEEEVALNKIYKSIIGYMEKQGTFLKKRLREIERVIDSLPVEEKTVIYHRYIAGVSWIDMPEYMMYELRTCQAIEMKALNKIAKMNIDWEGKKIEI